jgi:uncharacterized protein YeaO (DUF488 family)
MSDDMSIQAKRAHARPSPADGYRRGVEGKASIDEWVRDLAPARRSPTLVGPALRAVSGKALLHRGATRPGRPDLRAPTTCPAGTLTIVYAASDTDHLNAAVLVAIVNRGFPIKR